MDVDRSQQALRDIAADRAAKVARVLTGACSHDEYKYLCGEIHGLDLAEDHIKAVLKKEEDDE